MSAEYSVDAAFDAWVATLPAKHWAKYDISACRLGWEAQKANRIEADESAVPVAWGKFVADGGPCDGQLYEHADTKEEIEALIRDHPVDDCGSFRCAPLYTHPPAQAAQVAQLWEMKQRACLAHALCNELRLAHPEIPELGDDGVLHEAIHDILRVDTPTAEPVAQGEPSARDFTEEVGTNGKPTGYFIFKDANSPDAADSGRVDEILAHLKDPANVHVMMLRGVIAVPSIRSMVDLRGEVLNGEDVQLARIAELQEQLAAQGQGDGIDMRKYVRHLADVLEAGVGLLKVDADLQRLAAVINANIPAHPASPAGVPDDAWPRLELWFFRELTSAQRLSLFALHGLPVDEIGESHINQKRMLRRLLAAAPSAPDDAAALLDALQHNSWDLRCFDHTDGEDIGWRVIEHYQAEPRERVIAEVFEDNPRYAIKQALLAAAQSAPEGGEVGL